MTVRTPLKADANGNLIQMTAAEITAIKDRARWLYGSNPSITLTVLGSGVNLSENSGGLKLTDTRMKSGAASVGTAAAVPETETEEPQVVTINYNKIREATAVTTASADTGGIVFPVFYNNGNLQAMTLQDFYDTFIYDAIDTLVGSSGQPGMFGVFEGSTKSGWTVVTTTEAGGDNSIFVDTISNLASFDSDGIGEAGTYQDPAATNHKLYYLFQKDNIAEPSIELPVKARSSGDVQRYHADSFDTLLENCIRHAAADEVNHRIQYTYASDTNTTNLGTGIVDTRRQGDGRYATQLVGVDDYRSQEFPSGVNTAVSTQYLRVKLV